jgi:hypothetical protein
MWTDGQRRGIVERGPYPNRLSNFLLVGVKGGAVKVAVADLDGMTHSLD